MNYVIVCDIPSLSAFNGSNPFPCMHFLNSVEFKTCTKKIIVDFMIKAFLFDRDGVLIDSENIHYESVSQALQQLGFEVAKKELSFINARHPEDYKEEFLEKFNVNWSDYRNLQRKKYYELAENGSAIDKIINLAKQAKEKGYKISLTTMAGKESTQKILKFINLENFFDVIITRDDCLKAKPNPESYLKTAQKLNLKPEECIVFEDSKAGLDSAKNAGMKCVIIKSNNTIQENYSNADLVLKKSEITYKKIKNFFKLKQ